MSTLKAHNLRKRYGSRSVVRDVSLAVDSGQVVGLLGPNGAGKTTSFYMLTGLVASDGGKVLIDRTDITRLPIHKRAQLGIGYLPQEPSVFRKLSVADNVMAILETRPNLDAVGRGRRLKSLLSELNVTHLQKSQGDSLSGGERRRVEIARALAAEPRFMLLDEPFAGVDPISVNDIQMIIRYLSKRGIGVLITDHSVQETLRICDYSYIVNEGSILAEGTPEVVCENRTVREVYLGDSFQL